MTTLVTSFSQQGYDEYGREGLQSFIKHWPGKIVVYYEYKPPADATDAVEWRNLFDQQDCVDMCDWSGSVPFLCGNMPDGQFNFHFNLHKFGRKVFAITDALRRESGHVFWFDADTRFSKRVPKHFLSDLLEGVYTCYLGRKDFVHSETGFVGYDADHELNTKFVDAWRSMYADKTVLALPGFHDCWSYDFLVREFNAPSRNLTEDAVGLDVFPQSPLAEYSVHHKGNLKKQGAA